MRALSRTAVTAVGIAVGLSMWSARAAATPRPLPFTYTYDTLGEGQTEIETYVDMTPVAETNATNGQRKDYLASQYQVEFEHGLTDHLELGLYVAFQPTPSDAVQGTTATLTEGTGFKERLKYRLADEGAWPIDVALYGELVEYETEFEVEAKIILQRRIGKLRIAANAWAEREWYWGLNQQDWELNPTGGITYEINPTVHLGAEYWMRVEFPDPAPASRPFRLGPNQFVGPTAMFNFGQFWWSTGVYLRLNDVDRVPQPLDDYGEIWVRTVLGIEL